MGSVHHFGSLLTFHELILPLHRDGFSGRSGARGGRREAPRLSVQGVSLCCAADRGGLDVMRRLADRLNRAGEKCRAAGIKLCYHNHAFEFEPMEGSTPFQVLMESTDKNLVGLEM